MGLLKNKETGKKVKLPNAQDESFLASRNLVTLNELACNGSGWIFAIVS